LLKQAAGGGASEHQIFGHSTGACGREETDRPPHGKIGFSCSPRRGHLRSTASKVIDGNKISFRGLIICIGRAAEAERGRRMIAMTKLRDFWLEMVATCVAAVAIASIYTVLVGYAAGS